MAKAKSNRTTQGLRDILFDEIDQMRSPKGDPQRALAVAKLAQQIVSTAKVELDFHRTLAELAKDGQETAMGTLALGS